MVLVGMFSAAILSFGFGMFGYYICAKSSLLCTMNLRNAVYTKVLTYSFQNFNVISPASLITRLTNDAQKIQQALQMIFSTLIQMPIMLIGAAILILRSNMNKTRVAKEKKVAADTGSADVEITIDDAEEKSEEEDSDEEKEDSEEEK